MTKKDYAFRIEVDLAYRETVERVKEERSEEHTSELQSH